MSPFTPAVAAALTGPDWLTERRRVAAELFVASELPSSDEEVWRYSRIGKLDLDAFRPVDRVDTASIGDFATHLDVIDTTAAALVTRNGHLVASELGADLAAKGVTVGVADNADQLGCVLAEAPDAFATLNDAFAASPLVIDIPRGVTIDAPIVVLHVVDADHVAAFPRVTVRVGQGGSAQVVELVTSTDVEALVVPVVELQVARDARLSYLTVQTLGPRVWQVATQASSVDTQAHLTSSTAAFGGDYARQRTDCRLVGRGATGDLVSLYFGDGSQMLDFRTFQDHQAPDCTSDLLFKGALGSQSHSVYSGLIRVRPEASGTNAYQTNRNVKLSPDAWAESVPNLEIENNDVRCSHASTVGPIDVDQRFYLESRGVPPQVADRLIISGFFNEVFDRLPIPSLAAHLRAYVSEQIRAEMGV